MQPTCRCLDDLVQLYNKDRLEYMHDGENKKRLAASVLSSEIRIEASRGFEPLNKGFADPCLTTWRRRHLEKQERAMGFEPTTFSLARRRTTTVLRPQILANLPAESAETQDRTGDTAIFSRVLYQLSYLG